jgi:beta-galactosidase
VGDTFLNFETWGKGLVYVNGHPMGRIWEIGPQQTLYMPGCWLRKGENEILVFDIVGPRKAVSEGLREPILDKLQNFEQEKPAGYVDMSFGEDDMCISGSFTAGNGWQKVELTESLRGRYLALEALSAHDGMEMAAVAELYLIDADGKRLSREQWRVVDVDSEDIASANHSAEKTFDLQESTYWSSEPGKQFPHRIVIDLGAEYDITAVEYLPRMEEGAPHSIKDYKIYLK